MSNTDKEELLSAISLPNVGRFQPNKEFNNRSEQQDRDKDFIGYKLRPWAQQSIQPDTRRERKMISTLLTTQDDYPSDSISKLIEGDILYRDLASLSAKDLDLIGFKIRKQREELLRLFAELPNQNPSYESICQSSESQKYNNQILSNATTHLDMMRAAIAATNYKLQITPAEDVVVGDKRYASRFALEALKSVQGLTDELATNMQKLEELAKLQEGFKKVEKNKSLNTLKLFWISSISIGILVALWMWKIKKTI